MRGLPTRWKLRLLESSFLVAVGAVVMGLLGFAWPMLAGVVVFLVLLTLGMGRR